MASIKLNITGQTKILDNLQKAVNNIAGANLKGLLKAAGLIKAETKKLTPVDTGKLIESYYIEYEAKEKITVEIGTKVDYAVFVHEILHYKHPVGQAKFLETAIHMNVGKIKNIIIKNAKI